MLKRFNYFFEPNLNFYATITTVSDYCSPYNSLGKTFCKKRLEAFNHQAFLHVIRGNKIVLAASIYTEFP